MNLHSPARFVQRQLGLRPLLEAREREGHRLSRTVSLAGLPNVDSDADEANSLGAPRNIKVPVADDDGERPGVCAVGELLLDQ